ncbi:MAG: indole-3-glycerol phosphate synthase TrpC [Actinomycetota bacterium]|nr:indole-3-glycerol phosphate synthase TrpC [Actinomycetota bacterium]
MLAEIVTAHRRNAALDRRDLGALIAQARAAPPPRDFCAALTRPGLSVIAEVKRRSPSKGDLAPDLDPALVAKAYAEGGAAALSVLTDEQYFGGSPADLAAARAACDLPTLRKDFTVDPRDVADARIMGADAILLIVAALADSELGRFLALATQLGLTALVEVHDEEELDRAVAAGATVVGINQRNLRTFAVDRSLASRLRNRIPPGVVTVAESAIRTAADVPPGFDAVLVGESLVTAPDPFSAVRQLRGEQ